jgi:hypothetical protein
VGEQERPSLLYYFLAVLLLVDFAFDLTADLMGLALVLIFAFTFETAFFTVLMALGIAFLRELPFSFAPEPATPPIRAPTAAPRGPSTDPAAAPAAAPPAAPRADVSSLSVFFFVAMTFSN